ncbi:hypothetical protein [Bacillus bingmayongensis]|uniref:hypothetical protein n=1 Tax=Bacillus bingmayongensis TaxID=1150157 RepID=UPI0002E26F30|nr:hypothetical protein [Bacillus bingmayongensis]MBY0599193.1 hypothetical protein [Bacillus bingmayongensis]
MENGTDTDRLFRHIIGSGAQWEIANLAEILRQIVIEYEPWLEPYFEASKK